jgi:predicted DNA-binding transcriptional regulator YafY
MKHSQKPASLKMLDRIQEIHRLLEAPSAFMNADALARRLGESRRTVYRCIKDMRNTLRYDLPTRREGATHSYSLSDQDRRKILNDPVSRMRRTQALAFSFQFARQAVSQFRGTPFEEALVGAIRQFSDALGEDGKVHATEMDCVSIRDFAWEQLESEDFEVIHRATRLRLRLSFHYRPRGGSITGLREVEPFHLTYCFQRWYLVARKPETGEFRTYAVSRMKDVEVLQESFDREGFDINEHLEGAFGIVSGKKSMEIVVDFKKTKADLIRERVWHSSQTLTDLDDGGLRLKMKLSSLAEIEDWIMGWGPHAEVVKPKALRDRIAQSARGILDIYKSAD